MFGTMGISELIIILAIILIIFGAGRLPQIGEGVGKALKGFKKEVNEVPQPGAVQPSDTPAAQAEPPQPMAAAPVQHQPQAGAPVAPAVNTPYVPGPELTPGTTASMLYNMGPQAPQAARAAAPVPSARRTRSTCRLDGRAGGCALSRLSSAVPAVAPRRPAEARRQATIGDRKQRRGGSCAGSASGHESAGRSLSARRVPPRYAAPRRGRRRYAAHVSTGGRRRAQ